MDPKPPSKPDVVVESAFRPDSAEKFLHWFSFDEVSLPARENFKNSRREKIFSSLNELKLEFPGEFGFEGLGGLGKSIHGVFHSSTLLDFLESKRDILLPQPQLSSESATAKPEPPSDRELQRLELALFDVTKYNDACNYLTVVAWSEEHEVSGTVTLYQVLFDAEDNAIGVKPVAAMQDVPNQIVVKMRTDEDVTKAVFVPTDDGLGRFKWKANPHKGPTYVRLRKPLAGSQRPSPSPTRGREQRSVSSDSRGSGDIHGRRLADADGIHATIPQFVALLHGSRSILEDVESTPLAPLETTTGHVVQAVKLVKPPRAIHHKGDRIHVAVLLPNDAAWTDQRIYWTDDDDLAEFRQRRYWDLIERSRRDGSRGPRSTSPRSHLHSHSHSRSRKDDQDRGSRHRSRSRSRHDSKSGRHLSLHSLF
ncbi:hypothetical protein QBC47DRAFT_378215 [Echria macrotheca]|uniref:Uncharacterized protein n=1 Tax=Echria macrotheca TaxID=438768 RepID=A0AAJ0FDA9_9PEZI|nr:hypothetical protein QBC47DRAFT_378215 [Echria macrotheca]